MATAEVFKSGNSQAIRLPREFRFESAEVEITCVGNGIFLIEKQAKPQTGAELYEALVRGPGFGGDFKVPPDPVDLTHLKMDQITEAFREMGKEESKARRKRKRD